MENAAIGLALSIICGLACLRMAARRNRSSLWVFAGLVLNILGVIWVSCLPAVAPKLAQPPTN